MSFQYQLRRDLRFSGYVVISLSTRKVCIVQNDLFEKHTVLLELGCV
jgi:hypothetical protein